MVPQICPAMTFTPKRAASSRTRLNTRWIGVSQRVADLDRDLDDLLARAPVRLRQADGALDVGEAAGGVADAARQVAGDLQVVGVEDHVEVGVVLLEGADDGGAGGGMELRRADVGSPLGVDQHGLLEALVVALADER